jgi:hypothetical protein
VSLIERSNIPIGILGEGSADRNNLKLGLPAPASALYESSYFSSSRSQDGIR